MNEFVEISEPIFEHFAENILAYFLMFDVTDMFFFCSLLANILYFAYAAKKKCRMTNFVRTLGRC